MKTVCTVLAVLALATPAAAQTAANPLTSATKATFDIVKGYITKAAEKVPEDQYSFKPSPDVRTFGQLIGHIADANHMICGAAGGTGKSGDSVEKTKTTKADLQKALADSFAACDSVYASLTDAKGMETAKFFAGEQPRISILAFNTAHDFEHYGNLVTYMRIKGMVPPSSEPRPGATR
jgi:uncharacterized damage-inducible protein DinB